MSRRRKSTEPGGSLRDTLVEAAAALIAKKGPQGFSLREVARRAHVSEAAPYWHFTDREALLVALADGTVDAIATDHAPHTLQEKGFIRNENSIFSTWGRDGEGLYEKAHAGLPLVQHSLLLMLHYYKGGKISLEKIAEKMSHALADCFQIKGRGYIREGHYADLVIVDLNASTKVSKENILYKCAWSPLEGFEFPAAITHTFVNGNLVYGNNEWNESTKGKRLKFER